MFSCDTVELTHMLPALLLHVQLKNPLHVNEFVPSD